MQGFKEFWLLDEVESLNIKKGVRFGDAGKFDRNIEHSYDGELLGNFLNHNVYCEKYDRYGRLRPTYILTDASDDVKIVLRVKSKGRNSWQVDTVAASNKNTIPTHKFYAWIIKKKNIILVSGNEQSEGGKKVWERLSKEPGIGMHGWLNGKPVNLGSHLGVDTEDETHNKSLWWTDGKMDDEEYNSRKAARDMLLVAFKK